MIHPQDAPATPLFSKTSSILAWELSPLRPAPFNPPKEQKAVDLQSFLSNNSAHTLLIIPQNHSRSPLQITSEFFELLNSSFKIFPAFQRVVSTFIRDTSSDYYLGQSAAYFSPPPTPDATNQKFEFCCLLKFVEEHGRKPAASQGANRLAEVNPWSLRQQAVYHYYEPGIPKTERTILVNPSSELWSAIQNRYPSSNTNPTKNQKMSMMPEIIVATLSKNWGTYISRLHNAVEQLKRDTRATHYDRSEVGEANEKSLQEGLDLVDRLQHSAHALDSNVTTLRAIQSQLCRSVRILHPGESLANVNDFSHGVDEVIRELEFERSQIQHIMTRAQTVIGTVRDLLSLRGTHSMEQMTARTILEARTMRIIAFVTLAFLPPTFIAGFLSMGYIHVKNPGGSLQVSSEPGLTFYFLITVPLVVAIVGGYVYWDRQNKSTAKREAELVVQSV